MNLIRWTPSFDPFEEFDRSLTSMQMQSFAPAMDVYQTKDAVMVEAPLAGIDPNDVEISIENDVLTIKGKSEKKTEVDDKDYYRKEIRRGSFYRSVQLPTHVISDKASANYENGILKIEIPKAEEVKPKTIKIGVNKK
jgi:HSP20 family protein